VFVPKAKRLTLQELAAQEEAEKIKAEQRVVEKEDRKRQTREVSPLPSLSLYVVST